jgi:Tfp pilus assembly protein PilX
MPEATASRPAAVFNEYVLKAVAKIASDRAGKGYDLQSYFTRNLSYGPDNPGAIKANHPPLTMCVAAVTEIMIEALNLYCDETHDKTPFQKLPVASWKRGSMKDIRAHIFQYAGTNCHGTPMRCSASGSARSCRLITCCPAIS